VPSGDGFFLMRIPLLTGHLLRTSVQAKPNLKLLAGGEAEWRGCRGQGDCAAGGVAGDMRGELRRANRKITGNRATRYRRFGQLYWRSRGKERLCKTLSWRKAILLPNGVAKSTGIDVYRWYCGAGAPQVRIERKGFMVGAARFELTTPCAQGRCATRLRYAPTFAAP
jgi:hypothetical protein